MRTLSLIFITFCIAMTASVGMAKAKNAAKPMDHQAMMEQYEKMAAPGEQHKLLTSLVGSWTTKTTEWMEPGKPPMESTGFADMKMLLDGRFLQQDFSGNMMGKPFTGIDIIGYDNILKRYISIWLSTMGTSVFMMDGTASADGKTITLTGHHAEPGGGQMNHRAIWKIVDDNTQTFEMYGTHHGGKEMKVMEIVYSRKP